MLTLNYRYGDASPLPFDWLARLASTIARFWSRRRRERHARLIIADLQALNDSILKDIGLHRYPIESAVLNYGEPEWYALVAPTGWRAAPILPHIARCPYVT